MLARSISKLGCPLAVLLFCGFAAFAQDASPPVKTAIEDVYLAKDDGSGKAGEQVTEFATSDIPIHCVVLLEAPAVRTVKMNFVAVSVAGVKAETKVVSATYTTNDRQNRVNFTGRPDGKWTPGRYRVDIFLDGKPQRQLEFSIKGTGGGMPAGSKFVQPPEKPKPKRKVSK